MRPSININPILEQIQSKYKYIAHHAHPDNGDSVITLMETNGSSVVRLWFYEDYPSIVDISDLSVEKYKRKQGYADDIMKLIMNPKIYEYLGITHLQLFVYYKNPWLKEWYERLGFYVITDNPYIQMEFKL